MSHTNWKSISVAFLLLFNSIYADPIRFLGYTSISHHKENKRLQEENHSLIDISYEPCEDYKFDFDEHREKEEHSPNKTDTTEEDVHYTETYGSEEPLWWDASSSYLFFPYVQVYQAPNVVTAEQLKIKAKNDPTGLTQDSHINEIYFKAEQAYQKVLEAKRESEQEKESVPEPKSEPEHVLETEQESEQEPDSEPEHEPESEPLLANEPYPYEPYPYEPYPTPTESEVDPVTESESEPEPESEPESESEPISESEPEAESEPEPESEPLSEYEPVHNPLHTTGYFKSIILSSIDFDYLSKVPGCYPVIMPFMSTITSFFVNKVKENDHKMQNASEIEIALQVSEPKFEEYQSNYDLYQSTVLFLEHVNTAMESNHKYQNPDKFSGAMGSYYGVSLKKDLMIAKCDINQMVPRAWNEFKEFLNSSNEILEGNSFPYETITVDNLFFDFEDSTLAVGEYNFTEMLDPADFKYIYSKFDEMNEIQDTVSSKLRSGYDSMVKPRSSQDPFSPSQNHFYKIRTSRQLENNETSIIMVADIETENSCRLINSTNVQRCWEKLVTESFEVAKAENINSYFVIMDLTIVAYFYQFQVITSVMIGLAAAMLFELQHPLQTQLPCLYDIITSKNLEFDVEDLQNKTSILQSMVVPLGRHQFSTLPVRMIESAGAIISHENFEPAFTNFTEAAIKKFSAMIERGTLANKLEERSKELKEWLVSIDVLGVLEGIVQLARTVLKYRWQLFSGNWSELILLGDTLVEKLEGDLFWNRLGPMMVGVVKDRWELIHIFIKSYFEPYTITLVTYLEWLAEDVEGNLQSLTESIKKSDETEFVWSYWVWMEQEVKDYFICSTDEPEELLVGFYHYIFGIFGYFEPSFNLLNRESLCYLFDFCDRQGDREIMEASKVEEAIIEIYTPLVQLKQAIICNSNHVLNTYWQYVLF